MATGLQSWSKTAADNATADSNVNFAEGMAPSAVNNSARALMSSVAMYRDDTAGTLTTGGTSTAFTVTSNQVFGSLTELDGNELTVKFNATNGASPTLAVDGLTAKAIHSVEGTAIPTGALLADSIHRLTYDNANNCFVVNGWFPNIVTQLTAETTPAVADEVVIYDASASANRKMTLANLLKVITLLTAETAVSPTDQIAVYDASESATDKMTLQTVFNVVNGLTEDTSPDEAADFLLIYDSSANAAKKVKPDNLVNAGSAKVWALVTVSGGTPTLAASHNVASVTDVGIGEFRLNFTTAFAGTDYAVVATLDNSSPLSFNTPTIMVKTRATGSVTINTLSASGVNNTGNQVVDNINFHVVCYGTQ
jgi:hypothetical protein